MRKIREAFYCGVVWAAGIALILTVFAAVIFAGVKLGYFIYQWLMDSYTFYHWFPNANHSIVAGAVSAGISICLGVGVCAFIGKLFEDDPPKDKNPNTA